MRAIVLAAGTGSRLKDITRARTKGMVQVGGIKLIDHLFSFFEMNFFDEIIVVGGFCYEDLRDYIEQKKIDNVRVMQNPDYLKGNIFTLLTALDEFRNDSFLITNVDHIYPGVMFNLMKACFTGIQAMCDFDRNLTDDDMKVKFRDDERRILNISKELDDFDCGYIGMTYVDVSMENTYRKAAEVAIDSYGEKAVVENILQILSRKAENAPAICDLSGFGWYEVDDAVDLRKAEDGLKKNSNFKQ